MTTLLSALCLVVGACAAPGADDQPAPRDDRPRLMVVIVIDQLPGSVLTQSETRFAPRGFRLLMEQGAWFQQARYPQAATLTGVGHATVSTGGLPAGHGIAANDWFDRVEDREVYCVEDASHQWVGGKGKPNDGTSPRNLTSTTVGDEWRLAAGMKPRVIGISLKDRGSILLAGKFGKAYWYNAANGSFVSSTYYHPDRKLPQWVDRFNAAKPADKYFQQNWDLLLPRADYSEIADERPYEVDVPGLGRTFPHVLGRGYERPSADFYRLLATTPQGNELTLDLARAALEHEQLGRRGTTDMLWISLTANDYCGHNFGPESLEYQDITVRTDRQLEAFFADLDQHIGLQHVVIALTSDHGVAPSPEYLQQLGYAVGRIDPEELARVADAALDRAFGDESWAAMFRNPGLFLHAGPIRRRGVPAADVERVAADAVKQVAGVAEVFTRSQLAAGQSADTAVARSAAATFHPDRSPDLVIVQQPYWYLYKDMKKNAGMHGSPYPYDAHVPVLLFGRGVAAGRHARHVSPADIAPTLCHLLGIVAPSGCSGAILHEAMADRSR